MIDHIISDKAVCRTAPATPGLLIRQVVSLVICFRNLLLVLAQNYIY